jgi:hypothetical protein
MLHTIEMIIAELEKGIVNTILDLLVVHVDVNNGSA